MYELNTQRINRSQNPQDESPPEASVDECYADPTLTGPPAAVEPTNRNRHDFLCLLLLTMAVIVPLRYQIAARQLSL